MKLEISGTVPSKKNSKQLIVRGGRPMMLSSKRYLEWEESALWQLKGKKPIEKYPVGIALVFYFKDNRPHDLDNVAASVFDVLVKSGIVADDNYKHLCPVTLDYGGVGEKVEIYFDEV